MNIPISFTLKRLGVFNQLQEEIQKMNFCDDNLEKEYEEFNLALQKIIVAESSYLASQDATILE